MGIALTDDGIPVSHEVYSGNTSDVTCFKQLIDRYVNKHNAKNITFVCDRGMISNKNIQYLEEAHYTYVLRFRLRSIKKDERGAILEKVQLKELKESLSYKEIYYQDRRLIVYYNPERADLEKEK